jgi:hypothetical protein
MPQAKAKEANSGREGAMNEKEESVVDLKAELLKRLGDPCPLCSGQGIKAWHPKDLCPFGGKVQ